MTNDEANKVVEAFRPFDQFVANAPLNRNWHGTCQQLFRQAIEQIAALVVAEDKAPGQEPRKPADTVRGKKMGKNPPTS